MFSNKALSASPFMGLMERLMTRSTSALLTSGQKTRRDAFAPCNTSLIRLIRGKSCELSIRDVTSKPVNPVPDPNAWFHVRVVVASPKVSVFVNDAKEPSLVVNQLSDRKKGLVGLWVGNNSGGDFANLTLVPA